MDTTPVLLVTAAVIGLLVDLGKRGLRGTPLYRRPEGKRLLTVLALLLGVLAATIPGWLPGESFDLRLPLGLLAATTPVTIHDLARRRTPTGSQ